MATLVLSAVGTLVGGPVGGAVGALIGRQVDGTLIGSPVREGPRLTELAVSTSSYGQPVPRIYGTMRVAGSIIWATDLIEHRSTSGGKGQPRTASYSYSTSFAVALSSRPIQRVGRIWADGNLLRGAAGDLKAAVTVRIHTGRGDQSPDPLIASAQGGACPAFRGTAYAVFEDLDLNDFGNRVPALSFEVIADDAEVGLASLLDGADASVELAGLAGFALDGGSLADGLATIDAVYPLSCEGGEAQLRFIDPQRMASPVGLPTAVAAWDDGDFGGLSGSRSARLPQSDESPRALRHYDPERDYQPGIQRAIGPAPASGQQTIEFPGVLPAARARDLAEAASQRARWSRERLAWRMAELDPAVAPGSVVTVPGHGGEWLVTGWEWRERGVELELLRRRPGAARTGGGAAGSAGLARDVVQGPSLLSYFELPWDGNGSPLQRQAWVAVATTGTPKATQLFAVEGGLLTPLPIAPRADATIGTLVQALAPSPALVLECSAMVEVDLTGPGDRLADASADAMTSGANRLLIGAEVVQFARAVSIGGTRWRLTGLLRGRGGTETAAATGHEAGTRVVLLDDAVTALPLSSGSLQPPEQLAAIGLGDTEPVLAPLWNPMASIAPLCPVHPRSERAGDGSRSWRWTRRSRGSWGWPWVTDPPLVEERESWLVGVGETDAPLRQWQAGTASFAVDAGEWAELRALASGQDLWVRQVGSQALSPPLLLETIA
ncbi:phage tail protein [Parerythrobacter aurantius]|uniref:phage tail protein n=1 Tax=Parerythrobacter aurantius TaxID=3127706 RepID=UPI0032459929